MSNYDFTPKNVREHVEYGYQVQQQVQYNPEVWKVWYVMEGNRTSRDQARAHFERFVTRGDSKGVFRLVEKKTVTTTSHVVMEQEEVK